MSGTKGVGATANHVFAGATARLARSAYNISSTKAPRFTVPGAVSRSSEGPADLEAARSAMPAYIMQEQELPSPNDIAVESVSQLRAAQAFRASIAAFKVEDDAPQSLLDVRI